MNGNVSPLVRFCWGWIIFTSVITVVHVMYRTWWIAEGASGNVMPNVLNPGQPNDLQYIEHATASYLHIILGAVLYILGPVQFIDSVRRNHRNLHKLSGYIFIVSLLVSGIASIYMGVKFPVGGSQETTSTLIFATIMMFSVCRALYMVLEGNIELHKEWMIRSYMIALGPATMHMVIPMFIQIGGKGIGEALALSLWIGFVLHLILAEVWISGIRRSKVVPAKRASVGELRKDMSFSASATPIQSPVLQEIYEVKI